ncbi:hypothetical protein [Staphylococcus epidermidis]|uniref:hypothetical protein n=1 Tax=Staphylococcus epidermidis TaxID=1282 RepID=UPI00287FCA92|nr:hypothetical protein [Staphylococcus epidermidis]
MMNLFTDKNNNREWQLDEHIKQAKHDYLYANALLNNEGLLINNIEIISTSQMLNETN